MISDFNTLSQIKALSKLLNPDDEEGDDELNNSGVGDGDGGDDDHHPLNISPATMAPSSIRGGKGDKDDEPVLATESLKRENSITFRRGSENWKRNMSNTASSSPSLSSSQRLEANTQFPGKAIASGSKHAGSKTSKSATSIWDDDELEDAPLSSDVRASDSLDNRETPDYEMSFRHFVSAEDAYLGIDFEKDPSSARADALVIIIPLPKCNSAKDVVLEVTSTNLNLTSVDYSVLNIPFPVPVKDKDGNAQWDVQKKELRITLPIDHDLD